MTTTLRRVAVPEGRSGSAGESRCWLAKGGVDSGHASACSIRVAVVGCQLSVRVHEFLAPLSENGQTEPTEHSSPGARSTAPIAGPDDRPLPDSIARVEKVELNGSEQWIMVRGNDASNPSGSPMNTLTCITFVSSGQMVNTTENDRLGYELAFRHVEDQGDARHAEERRRNGPPPYQGDNVVSPNVAFLDVLNEIMGTPRFSLIVPVSPFFVPEYG